MIKAIFYSALCILCFAQCADTTHSENSDSPETKIQASSSDQASSTQKMAERLAQAYRNIDPTKAPYLVNNERVELFKAQTQQGDIPTRINAWSYYAYELLNAGNSDQAVIQLEALLQEIQKYKPTPDTMLRFRRLLALAYLRLGEQANCINTRNHASCIVPIVKEGQYQMTEGSETAMQHCISILETFPGDEETIWILNLAAMTIGKYPDGVPAKWRLPESFFYSRTEFPRFRDVSHDVGITGTGTAGGSCVEDFDQDGWLDIIASSWGKDDPLIFWKNAGNGSFVNASASMGLEGITGGLNLVHADANNDGLPDILVLRGAWLFDQGKIPNSLLINKGNGQFIDVTEEAGLLTYAPTQNAAFADYNQDGWIDFFIGNESSSHAAFPNEFYLNNQDGTFRNVIDQIGVRTEGFIKGSVAGDVNNDGLPDLYLSNYRGPNMLLLNKGVGSDGILRFENIAEQAAVQEPLTSFPCWIWDFDNDGWEDIFVSQYGDGTLAVAKDFVQNANGKTLGGQPRIYRNNGNLTFTEVSAKMGMKDNVFTMGCNYGDLDADGFLDFYLGTGNPEYSSVVPNKMYRNHAGKAFEDVTTAGGFGHIQKGHAIAFGDLDRDGDEEIFETLGGAFQGDIFEDILFENPIGQNKSWVVLQLLGSTSNRMAIGARVKITTKTPKGAQFFHRTVSTGSSFGSSSLQLEVGLGDAQSIESIEVIWPNKAQTKQVFQNVSLKKYMRITEGESEVKYLDVTAVEF